jgi:hypothetical protein
MARSCRRNRLPQARTTDRRLLTLGLVLPDKKGLSASDAFAAMMLLITICEVDFCAVRQYPNFTKKLIECGVYFALTEEKISLISLHPFPSSDNNGF